MSAADARALDDPTPEVRYTAPGPPQVQPVTLALDDPRVVSYGG